MRCFILLFFFSSFNLFAGEKVRFHKAETEAEKALNRILIINNNVKSYKNEEYNDISAFIEGLERYLPMKEEKINLYKGLFSQDFIKAGHDQFDKTHRYEKSLTLDFIKNIHAFSGKPQLDCNWDNRLKTEFFLYYTLGQINNKIYIYAYRYATFFYKGIAQKKVKIEKENRFLQTVLHNPNVYGLIYVMKQENDKWKIDGFNCRYADDDIYTINYSNFTPR